MLLFFSAICTKGDNFFLYFLFCLQDSETFQKKRSTLKGKNLPWKSKFFPLRVD